MVRLKEKLLYLLRDEEGQSTTEYILILAVVVMIAVKMKGTLVPMLTGKVEQLSGDIDQVFEP